MWASGVTRSTPALAAGGGARGMRWGAGLGGVEGGRVAGGEGFLVGGGGGVGPIPQEWMVGVGHLGLALQNRQRIGERGAAGITEPHDASDDHGTVRLATIATYGDTIHTFVERGNYHGVFLPGFRAEAGANGGVDPLARPVGLKYVDHMVGNVGWNEMNRWADYYADILGFSLYQHFDDKDISTEYSALMSKVMANGNGRLKFPINEPAEGRKKSQIEEYLEFYRGPGVQHVAMATDDILDTVSKLHAQGVAFLRVPHTYYTEMEGRVGKIDEPTEELEKLGILVDRDDEGYMLQIFTKPVEDRPTVFYEIIQRKGSRSFGKGNFKALFEAIEREQELRGNL